MFFICFSYDLDRKHTKRHANNTQTTCKKHANNTPKTCKKHTSHPPTNIAQTCLGIRSCLNCWLNSFARLADNDSMPYRPNQGFGSGILPPRACAASPSRALLRHLGNFRKLCGLWPVCLVFGVVGPLKHGRMVFSTTVVRKSCFCMFVRCACSFLRCVSDSVFPTLCSS